MPRSSSSLLCPPDYGSLEYITLHLEISAMPPEPHQLVTVIDRQTLGLASLDSDSVHPLCRRLVIDPEVSGHLSYRFTYLPHVRTKLRPVATTLTHDTTQRPETDPTRPDLWIQAKCQLTSSGGNHGGASQKAVYFRLSTATSVTLTIAWPNDAIQKLDSAYTGQFVEPAS